MALCSIPLVMVLLGGPITAAFAPGEPATGVGYEARASLQVDTSEVGTAGPVLRRRIEERGNVVLRRAEMLPGRGGEDPTVVIALRELQGDDPGYTFEIWVTRRGEEVKGSRQSIDCRLCTESEVVERTEEEIAKAVPTLREAGRSEADAGTQAGPTQAPSAEPRPGTDAVDTSIPVRGDRERLGVMGKTGIGVMVAGLIGTGVGIGLALRDPTPLNREPTLQLNTHVPGYVMIGVGGAALATGIVLAAVDGTRRSRAIAIAPWIWRGVAGLHVTRSF